MTSAKLISTGSTPLNCNNEFSNTPMEANQHDGPSPYFQVQQTRSEAIPKKEEPDPRSLELKGLFDEAAKNFEGKKSELLKSNKKFKAAEMIGADLCTGNPLFREYLQNSCKMQKAETYFRSSQTPHETAKIEADEKNAKTRGANEHIGNYKNSYDIVERSEFEANKVPLITSSGDSTLYYFRWYYYPSP